MLCINIKNEFVMNITDFANISYNDEQFFYNYLKKSNNSMIVSSGYFHFNHAAHLRHRSI